MKTLLPACATAFLILSFTLCLDSTVRAQNTPAPATSTNSPSAVVPTDHWAYQAVDTLQKSGIPIVDSKGSPIGQIPMTRHDFAQATARLLQVITTNTPDLTTQKKILVSKIEGNDMAMDALVSLTDEFSPELKAMGVDVAGAKARLNALEARLAAIDYEQRRVKITEILTFIPRRGGVNTSTLDTEPLDKNGYRITSASSHSAGDSHSIKHRFHKRAVHSRHHRHRRKKHRTRHRS